ncbi:hypothetical protein JCM19233_6875 [Vibrio astriarenae]|nr:hypothetical protein JCM19233_6875 [Vibrio sp. C7]
MVTQSLSKGEVKRLAIVPGIAEAAATAIAPVTAWLAWQL